PGPPPPPPLHPLHPGHPRHPLHPRHHHHLHQRSEFFSWAGSGSEQYSRAEVVSQPLNQIEK
ncbi:Hypothetical predicted protein, partial [Scomber scombrus]